MTLLAPTAYASIAVMYCQIVVTFLSVTRGHRSGSREGSQLLLALWYVYAFTFHLANIKIFAIKLQIIGLLGVIV